MDECCGGYTICVTVGDAEVTLHDHATLTVDAVDTLLSRCSVYATTADRARATHLHGLYGAAVENHIAVTPADTDG